MNFFKEAEEQDHHISHIRDEVMSIKNNKEAPERPICKAVLDGDAVLNASYKFRILYDVNSDGYDVYQMSTTDGICTIAFMVPKDEYNAPEWEGNGNKCTMMSLLSYVDTILEISVSYVRGSMSWMVCVKVNSEDIKSLFTVMDEAK